LATAGADDPRLAYAPELNAVFGRVVVPAPPGYEPPPEQHRPKETASLAVAILTELAKTEDVLILLHIQTNTDNEKKLPFDAWKIARDVARNATRRKKPERTLLLCIVSRATMFSTNNADVEEIISLANEELDPIVRTDEKRLLNLDPLNEVRRRNYLFEFMRTTYEPKLLPESVPEHLVEYVSEVAGGVPLQISEVLEQLTLADNRKVTFIRPEAIEDGVARVQCVSAEELNDRVNTPVPPKILAAAEEFYNRLSEKHRLIVKMISPLPSFSIDMVNRLLTGVISLGGNELSVDILLLVFNDLVKLGVFQPLDEVTTYIVDHDPGAHGREGYVFLNKLMQQQCVAFLLQKERDNIQARMEELRQQTAEQRRKELEARLKLESPSSFRSLKSGQGSSKALEPSALAAANGEDKPAAVSPTVSPAYSTPVPLKPADMHASDRQRLRIRARFRTSKVQTPATIMQSISSASKGVPVFKVNLRRDES